MPILQAEPAHPFVSRGGVKLSAAFEHYPIDIEDHVCLDVGASTGGFTEVLLANGACTGVRDRCLPGCSCIPRARAIRGSLDGIGPIFASYDGKRLPQRPDVVVDRRQLHLAQSRAGRWALSLAASPMKPVGADQAAIRGPPRESTARAASSRTPPCMQRSATTSRPSRPRSAVPRSRCSRRRSRAAMATPSSSSGARRHG